MPLLGGVIFFSLDVKPLEIQKGCTEINRLKEKYR
jgi:hypothetical protein